MTNESTSLLSLGDLTKPATVLIEKISNAVGKIYEPIHIVKAAKSQATARIIEAESNIQIQELQQRALQRFLTEETRKQSNIESITTKALEGLKAEAHPEDIEDDWVVNFFDKCKLISDEEMQQLWARILTNEANEPGTYSRRTINALYSIEKTEADLFNNLCSYCFYFDDEFTPLFFIDGSKESWHDNRFYAPNNLNFESLSHLNNIGLINFDALSCFSIESEETQLQTIDIYYFNKFKIRHQKNSYINVGHAKLTRIGLELSKVCNPTLDSKFFEYILNKWIEEGHTVYCDIP